jgi:Flp pilus assembly protein TadG
MTLARERGSAPVEFVLVSGLLVAVALALIQLSVVVHVRHTLIASAQEGARWAGYEGTSISEGVRLTQRLIRDVLSDTYAQGVSAQVVSWNGAPHVRVIVISPLPTVGLWGGAGSLRVFAGAPVEQPKS